MTVWLAVLVALTLLRLILAANLPLAPDEAYYWLWSRHLQPGYFDHPPMVALWIRTGTAIAGATPLGVRLLAPLSAAAGSILLWSAGEDLFPRRQAGLIAASLINATVLVGAGSIITTPDTPLFFFWIGAIAALARLTATQNPRWWLAVGAAAGCALLSKYTGLLLITAIGLWLLTHPHGRAALRTPWPWVGLAIAALIFAPNLLWNADNNFVSYVKQGGRVAAFNPARAAQFLAELLAGQLALATPIIFALCAYGIYRLARQRAAATNLLLWLTLLPAAIFLEHVVSDRVQSNWPAIAYPAACLAAAAVPAPVLRVWLKPALALGFAVSALVYLQAITALMPIPARQDPTALQLAGWQNFAAAVAAHKAAFYTSDEYGPASELAFLLPPGAIVAGFGGGFDRRWDYLHLPLMPSLQGATGILVTRRADAKCTDPIGTLTRNRGTQIIATYRLCRVVAQSPGVLLSHP